MTVEMTRVRVPRLFYSRNDFFVKQLQRVRVIMSFDEKKKNENLFTLNFLNPWKDFRVACSCFCII